MSVSHEDVPVVAADRDHRTYLQLVEAFPLRPIRSDDHLAAAITVMRSLLGIERNPDEADYLNVLGTLIREYETDHVALPTLTPADVLRALMEDRGISQAERAAATGIADADIAAILANRRGISQPNRAALADYFGVSPARIVVA